MRGLLLAALALAPLWTAGAAGPAERPAAAARTVQVSGQGTVQAAPDMATLQLGVETFSPRVEDALRENRSRMQSVVASLKASGVPDADLQTASFDVLFERQEGPREPQPGAEPALRGAYRVSNTVSVTLRDLSALGAVLDNAVAVGANQIWGIRFGLSRAEEAQSAARDRAMEDARRKAEQLARLAGVEPGAVVSIQELAPGAGPPGVSAEGLGGGPTPVIPGELSFTVRLTVRLSVQYRIR